jgi:UDP-N-acetylglucosamine acyltransferase
MSAKIHATAVVDKNVELGPNVEIGPGCVIGPNVKIGQGTKLIAHVFIEQLTEIGKNNTIFPFVGLGGEPQDLSYKNEPTKLVIGDNNVIREHATIHRGTARGRSVTTIGNECLIMGNCHVAHDCRVGNNVIMAQTATIGGHVQVGDYAFLGGLSGVHQHGRVGRYSFVGASALMTTDLIPFGSAIGNHAHLGGLNVVGL